MESATLSRVDATRPRTETAQSSVAAAWASEEVRASIPPRGLRRGGRAVITRGRSDPVLPPGIIPGRRARGSNINRAAGAPGDCISFIRRRPGRGLARTQPARAAPRPPDNDAVRRPREREPPRPTGLLPAFGTPAEGTIDAQLLPGALCVLPTLATSQQMQRVEKKGLSRFRIGRSL